LGGNAVRRVEEPKSALSAVDLQGLFERHDIQARPRPGMLDSPKQLNPLMEIDGCGACEWRGRRFFARCNFAILTTREKKKKQRPQVTDKRERYLLGGG
jgi:hypothetical protein